MQTKTNKKRLQVGSRVAVVLITLFTQILHADTFFSREYYRKEPYFTNLSLTILNTVK